MGRVLCSVAEDTCGWHDPIGAYSTDAMVTAKYGEASYQQHRNDYHRSAQENFLIELAKWGLGERDLTPNVNFFSKVAVGDDGTMRLQPGNSKAGDYVELRAEMNVLVILGTCQHPLDESSVYQPKPVHVALSKVAPPAADDPCRLSRP